jgi:hypothetical protein
MVELLNNMNSNVKSNISTYTGHTTTSNTSKVKELKLTKTNLTDESACLVFKCLETNQSINNLNVAKNYLTDKSIDSLVSLLNKNKIIKTLYLSYNNFSSTGKDKLKSYTGGVKNLKIFI